MSRSPVRSLLEDCLLQALGELPAERARQARALTAELFGPGGEGDWCEHVREQFGLRPAVFEEIHRAHAEARTRCGRAGVPLDGRAFVREVVDQNLVEVVEIVEAELRARRDAEFD